MDSVDDLSDSDINAVMAEIDQLTAQQKSIVKDTRKWRFLQEKIHSCLKYLGETMVDNYPGQVSLSLTETGLLFCFHIIFCIILCGK
jgi:hypothetical protein